MKRIKTDKINVYYRKGTTIPQVGEGEEAVEVDNNEFALLQALDELTAQLKRK